MTPPHGAVNTAGGRPTTHNLEEQTMSEASVAAPPAITKTRRARGEGSLWLRGRTWWIAYYQSGRKVQMSAETRHRRVAQTLLSTRLGRLAARIGPS